MTFPAERWSRIDSTDQLERLEGGVNRRADLVCIFAGVNAVLRPVGSELTEIPVERQAGQRCFSLGSMTKLKEPQGLLLLRTGPLRPARVRYPCSYHNRRENVLED